MKCWSLEKTRLRRLLDADGLCQRGSGQPYEEHRPQPLRGIGRGIVVVDMADVMVALS